MSGSGKHSINEDSDKMIQKIQVKIIDKDKGRIVSSVTINRE